MDELLSPAWGQWSAVAAGLSGPLGGYKHFSAPQGCVLGPFAFYSQVCGEKVFPETHSTPLLSLLLALLPRQTPEDSPPPPQTNTTTVATTL